MAEWTVGLLSNSKSFAVCHRTLLFGVVDIFYDIFIGFSLVEECELGRLVGRRLFPYFLLVRFFVIVLVAFSDFVGDKFFRETSIDLPTSLKKIFILLIVFNRILLFSGFHFGKVFVKCHPFFEGGIACKVFIHIFILHYNNIIRKLIE